MSGVSDEIQRLRLRLFQNHSQLRVVADRTGQCHREWDALQVERQQILAEFLELGLTPEDVLWDRS